MPEFPLRPLLRPLIVFLAATFCLFLAFFPFFSSGCDRLSGDLGDNRFYVVILEHWRAVAQGRATWADPNFFYPLKHVLGFSDALVLYVPPYLMFRSLGADRYYAYQGCLILLRLIGFVGVYLLLQRGFAFPLGIAIFGSALFSLSSMYSAALGHGQLASVGVVPLMAWLAVSALRLRIRRPGASLLLTGTVAFLFGALMLTSYYIAFFCALLVGVVFLVVGLSELWQHPGEAISRLGGSVRSAKSHAVVACLCLIPWIFLFVALYLPVVRESGTRPFWEVQMQTVAPTQIINPGTTNLVWGGIVQAFPGLFQVNLPRETGRGWPLVTFSLFLAISVGWMKRGGWLAATGLAVLLLAVTATGMLGLYPWWAIYELVPGASGVRVPGRVNLVLNVAVTALVADGIRRWFQDAVSRRDSFAAFRLCALCIVILLEQLNFDVFPGYSHSEETASFLHISKTPATCRSFLVARSSRPSADWRNLDAMLIARERDLPTINGYSGVFPKGGGCPNDERQCEEVLLNWAKERGVMDGLCDLDLRTGKWLELK